MGDRYPRRRFQPPGRCPLRPGFRAAPRGARTDGSFRDGLHEQLPRASAVGGSRHRAAGSRSPTRAPGRSGDRASAEHPTGRRPVLGLHRPQGRLDGRQPPGGGGSRGPADRGPHRPVPAVFDQGPTPGTSGTGPPVPQAPPRVARPRQADAVHRHPSLTPVVSIVVPVYDEGPAVEPILRSLTTAVSTSHEILVVYDYDADPTIPVVARVSLEFPAIRGHRNDLGRGVLNAMKSGLAASTGRYIVVSMADGSDDPGLVDEMVELADRGADVV